MGYIAEYLGRSRAHADLELPPLWWLREFSRFRRRSGSIRVLLNDGFNGRVFQLQHVPFRGRLVILLIPRVDRFPRVRNLPLDASLVSRLAKRRLRVVGVWSSKKWLWRLFWRIVVTTTRSWWRVQPATTGRCSCGGVCAKFRRPGVEHFHVRPALVHRKHSRSIRTKISP